MSHGLLEDTGLENPLAVHIRNFPVSLINQEKFKDCISSWRGVDVHASSCHPNPNNTAWNGWAIVYFESEQTRNSFITNENQHYVRDQYGDVHKLKVKKWIEKQGQNNSSKQHSAPTSSTSSYTLPPQQKQEIIYREPTLEEFEKRVNEASNKCFKGIIKSYLSENGKPKLLKQGYSGLVAVTVIHQGKRSEELVLFHSSCVWVCTVHTHCRGTQDCAHKCKPADNLPAKLRVDSEVYLTVRRVPSDIQCSVSYQAKCVWQGEASLPDFISVPVRGKLDQYLDEYVDEVDVVQSEVSKAPSIFLENKEKKNTSGGVIRQKPLTGGLKQLNSDLTKKFVTKVEKRQVPTNFAEAVTAAAKTEQQILADSGEAVDLVEKAVIDSFPAKDRVVVCVGEHGRFYLGPHHFDNNLKDLQSYLADTTELLVALSLNKEPGQKFSGKYVVVRAFAESQKFSEPTGVNGNMREGSPKTNQPDNDRNRYARNRNESSLEIDLDELDRYYDTQHEIGEYLRRQIPILIPDLKPSSNFLASLINNIITAENENTGESDVEVLNKFFSHQKFNVNVNQKQKFIADYHSFRKSLNSSDINNENATARQSPHVQNGVNSEPDKCANVNALHLSALEIAFLKNRQANKETQSSILRIIILLRKACLDIESIIGLYRDYCKSVKHNSRSSSGFSVEFQSHFSSYLDQRMLDDANHFLRTSGSEENTAVFNQKLEAYFPAMASSISSFLESYCGSIEARASKESDTSATESVSSSCSSSPLRSLPPTRHAAASLPPRSSAEKQQSPLGGKHRPTESSHKNNISRKQSSDGSENFDKLEEYLESVNYSNINLTNMLKQKNMTLLELNDIFEDCKSIGEGGKMKWNLEISKLKLNPGMGVTVFKIAELLWNFLSLFPVEKKLQLIPPLTFFSIYKTEDYAALKKNLYWEQLEKYLLEGIEILCYNSILLKSQEDLKEHASMIGKLWRSCGINSKGLENDIKHLIEEEDFMLENYFHPLRKVLGKWAGQLEKVSSLKNARINILNVMKATLTSYHPNVYEGYNESENETSEYGRHNVALFKNIVHDTRLPGSGRLYAVEGIVVGTLDTFAVVQTMFCKILVHPAVYVKDQHFNLEMSAAELSGCLLTVDSCPVFDDAGNFLFQLADLAWTSKLDVDHGDEPYPGLLMPFPQTFYASLTQMAQEVVSRDNKVDLCNLDFEEQRVVYGMVWFQHRAAKNPGADSIDEFTESLILISLIEYEVVPLEILDSTILDFYACHSVTRFMPGDEFLHTFLPYLRSTRLFRQMTECLDNMSSQEDRTRLQHFLAKFPSRFSKVLLDTCQAAEDPPELEVAGTPVPPVSSPPPAPPAVAAETSGHDENQVLGKIEDILTMVKENKAAIGKIEKRLDDLDQIVMRLPSLLVPNQAAVIPVDRARPQEPVMADRCYVRIWREEDGEVEEIPTNKEGLLALNTIRGIFPGAQGLKFRVTSSGRLAWRNLLLENGNIHPPEDGWGERVYLAAGCVQATGGVYRSSTASASTVNSSSTISYLPSHLSIASSAAASAEQIQAARVSNGQLPPPPELSGVNQLAQLQAAHGQLPPERGTAGQLPQLQTTPGQMTQLQQGHGQVQQLQPERSSAGQLPQLRPGRNRNSQQQQQLSQLMMNQTPSSIWGSSPATILGGISPVSLDFQDSTNNFGIRDQLN